MKSCPLVCVAVLGIAAACTDPAQRPTTWEYLHPAVIAPSCASATCHSSLAARAGLVLEDRDHAYRLLIDERFVIPGDPASPLMYVLRGDQRVRMPPDAPLPEVDVDLVEAWIVDGASP